MERANKPWQTVHTSKEKQIDRLLVLTRWPLNFWSGLWPHPLLQKGTSVKNQKQNCKQCRFRWDGSHEPSHLDLHCLHKYLFWFAGLNGLRSTSRCLLTVPRRRFLLTVPRRRFLLTVPRQFLCCSSSLFVCRWFHILRLFIHYLFLICSSFSASGRLCLVTAELIAYRLLKFWFLEIMLQTRMSVSNDYTESAVL